MKGNDKIPNSWKFIKDYVDFKKKLEVQPDKPIGFAKMSKVEKISPNESRILHCLAKAKCHGKSVNVLLRFIITKNTSKERNCDTGCDY